MTQRTMDALACIVAVVAFAFIMSFTHKAAKAGSVTRDDAKEVLRLQYTEFCATVKKPPKPLIDALNQALEQDPETWGPIVQNWFNPIAEKYAKARCGDA